MTGRAPFPGLSFREATAFVTGGGSGIGLETVLTLADLGARVAILDWTPGAADAAAQQVRQAGGQAVAFTGDTGDEAVKEVRAFSKEYAVNYPLLIGDEATLDRVPSFEGYPTTLFLDREGKVRARLTGYQSLATLEAMVAAIADKERARIPAAGPGHGGSPSGKKSSDEKSAGVSVSPQ